VRLKVNRFTKHPEEVDMTYWQHFVFALNLAQLTLRACLASIIHAFFPFLFITTTSNITSILYSKLKTRIPNEELRTVSKNTEIDLQYIGIIRKTGS